MTTEWQNGSLLGHSEGNVPGKGDFHPCHPVVISPFGDHSDSELPSNGGKSQSLVIPVTSPNLTFGCTIFLQTLWHSPMRPQGMRSKWCGMMLVWWNGLRMTWMTLKWLKWDRSDKMALEMWNGIRMASNDNGMTPEWWYSDRMKKEWLNDTGMTEMSQEWRNELEMIEWHWNDNIMTEWTRNDWVALKWW